MGRNQDPAVDVQDVCKIFPTANGKDLTALTDISLSVERGRFIAIVGPSGCGKTTLLRIIAGVELATSGTTLVFGQPPPEAQASGALGFAFQDTALLPWRSVAKNIALPLEILRRSPKNGKVSELISTVGLEGSEKAYPIQLSGGMRQRVSLARSLVSEPSLLLLDEPFANLDDVTRSRMNHELLSIVRSYGPTTLMVTHTIADAVFLADEVQIMRSDPGMIVATVEITRDDRQTPEEWEESMKFRSLCAVVKSALVSAAAGDS